MSLYMQDRRGFVIYVALIATLICGAIYGWMIFTHETTLDSPLWTWLLIGVKTLIEIAALFYGFTFLVVGLNFLFSKRRTESWITPERSAYPSVGIIFLVCDDVDEDALNSVSLLDYPGKLHLIVHDDSTNRTSAALVDVLAEKIMKDNARITVKVLRRRDKHGGKPGAVNYVLERTGQDYEYFVLCDNDSTFMQPDSLQKALAYFRNRKTAVAQFRIIGLDDSSKHAANSYLKKCIDAFHVFMHTFSRHGWQPFVGHNAMLRTGAVLGVGGFTPGFFSDDLDMTVRLNLRGYQVAYAENIMMGERHPPNYSSFRARSYKWAYGCMQTVRRHLTSFLSSRKIGLAEKTGFLLFVGFYFIQSTLLLYLLLTFLVLPLTGVEYPVRADLALIAGTVIAVVIFLPFVAYFIKEEKGEVLDSLWAVVLGGLVYGSADFSCIRGILDCLAGRTRKWVPTNAPHLENMQPYLLEAFLGVTLLLAPLYLFTPLLFFPCSYLFTGKFLFAPMLYFYYSPKKRQSFKWTADLYKTSAASAVALALALVVLPVSPNWGAETNVDIEIKGKEILVGGETFVVKGIHYGPWRPGTGPNKGYDYPSVENIRRDLALIQRTNANTILVYDAPLALLDIACEFDLRVFYVFAINWYGIDSSQTIPEKQRILQFIQSTHGKGAILGWVLGNEIPEHLLVNKNAATFENALHDMYNAIKTIDGDHPVTHASWPPARSLDLGFLDMISFNLYPFWPIEVVTRGYQEYLTEVIMPVSGDKPLLITEFGVNSLEAKPEGQARIYRECWEAIRQSRAIGGIVFEFADEWWKNYDNPVRPQNYWYRTSDTLDEKTHDLDPEEYYGIVTADRQPKPAYEAVREMFNDTFPDRSPGKVIPRYIVYALFALALLATLWAWRRN